MHIRVFIVAVELFVNGKFITSCSGNIKVGWVSIYDGRGEKNVEWQ